jgi:hypothetical protein
MLTPWMTYERCTATLQQFYDGLLVDGVRAADRTRPEGFAFPSAGHNVVLVDIDGEEQTSLRGSHSNEKVQPAGSWLPGAGPRLLPY